MAPRPARRTARDLTGLVLSALLVLLALRLLGAERGGLLDLLVGALPLVLLPAYPLLLVAVLLRARLLTLLGVLAVGGHLLVVAPALGAAPVPAAAREAPRLRVVTANLYVGNPDPAAAGRALRALHPDVLLTPELTAEGLDGLRQSGLMDDLPSQEVGLTGRAEGVGLFSRLPLTERSERAVDVRLLPRATVRVGGVAVRLVAGHPLPPVSAWEPLWRSDLGELADEVSRVRLPVVVAGDLNSDRDHAPFRRLLATGLRDAADERGHGLARTWPVGLPLLQLDHVLVRDGAGGRLVVLDVHEARVPGSDHLAVVTDLAVLPR